jgi:hypothetical protein
VALNVLVLGAAVFSEWRGVQWWTGPSGPSTGCRYYIVLARGELRVGYFDTEFQEPFIPRHGLSTSRFDTMWMFPPERRWMAWRYCGSGRVSYVLPVTPIAGASLAVGLLRLLLRRREPHECNACGYDLRGANGQRCPECGHAATPVG